jgi:hypothetical protein
MSAGRSLRVVQMLSLFRDVADEIVVAVDDRGDPDVMSVLAALADQVVTFPFADPLDRTRQWLHAQCSGEWVLVIDDDEVPSAALLEALPSLASQRDVTHVWMRVRWLFPDVRSYLAEPPWFPGYSLRLMLNDERFVRFPGEPHWPFAASGPSRYVDLPVYHAACILVPRAEREARALERTRGREEKRVTGGDIDSVYYVPERRKGVGTAPVPDEDRRLLDTVLESRGGDERRGGVPVRAATRGEIDRHWAARMLGEAAYAVRLTLLEQPFPMRAGEQRTFDVLAQNNGDTRFDWGTDARPPVFASYHWRDPEGELVEYNGIRTPLPVFLPPGAAEIVPVHVVAPAAPGSYVLELDLVHEGVRWFECGLTCPVDVVASDEEIEAWSGRNARGLLSSLLERVRLQRG